MKYAWGDYCGQDFPAPDSPFRNSQIMDFIQEYGDQALNALEKLDPADAQIIEQILEDDLLDRVASRYRLTPWAINQLQCKALEEDKPPAPGHTPLAHDHDPRCRRGAAGTRRVLLRQRGFGELRNGQVPVGKEEKDAHCLRRKKRAAPVGETPP